MRRRVYTYRMLLNLCYAYHLRWILNEGLRISVVLIIISQVKEVMYETLLGGLLSDNLNIGYLQTSFVKVINATYI